VTDASFNVEVTPDSAIEFAKLSGDWNPLRRSVARLPRPQVRCPDRATGHAAGGRSGREGPSRGRAGRSGHFRCCLGYSVRQCR